MEMTSNSVSYTHLDVYKRQVLAGVVAETEAQARAAVERIRVEYEVLEPLSLIHISPPPAPPRPRPACGSSVATGRTPPIARPIAPYE